MDTNSQNKKELLQISYTLWKNKIKMYKRIKYKIQNYETSVKHGKNLCDFGLSK